MNELREDETPLPPADEPDATCVVRRSRENSDGFVVVVVVVVVVVPRATRSLKFSGAVSASVPRRCG